MVVSFAVDIFFVDDTSIVMAGGRNGDRSWTMGGTRTTPEGRTTDIVAADAKDDELKTDDAAAVAVGRTGPVGEKGLNDGGPAATVVVVDAL